MRQMLKRVLIWLVVLAIPAQGSAAAAMMHCAPGHHGAQAAQRNFEAVPEALQVAHGGHAAHGHSDHAAPAASMASDTAPHATSSDAAATAQGDGVSDPGKSGKPTYQKCSACAYCCAGLALLSTAVVPPTIDPAREVTLLSPPAAVSVVVDGPERPPRILSA